MYKKVLLIGAGFSKNFGGYLANEVLVKIFSHPDTTPSLKNYIVKNNYLINNDFEQLYEDITEDEKNIFSTQEKILIRKIVLDVYRDLDQNLQSQILDLPPKFSYLKALSFIINNFSCMKDGIGYIFSLNQDLLLERLFSDYLKHRKFNKPAGWDGEYKGALLAHYGPINSPFYKYHKDDKSGLQESITIEDITQEQINDWMRTHSCTYESNRRIPCLIKLHGSYYWREGNTPALIIGKGKQNKIQSIPLLKLYFDKFNEVMGSGNLEIYVIGYSFKDPHINHVILNACQNGSHLVVVDIVPLDKWLDDINKEFKKLGASFKPEWLKKYIPCSFNQLFNISTSEQGFIFNGDGEQSLNQLESFPHSLIY